MLNKIENIKETVKRILINYPDARDNDRLLIIKVWAEQEPKLRDGYDFRQFGVQFINGEFVDSESIRRTRQKLQESDPYLRGRSYSSRKDHANLVSKAMKS